MESVGEWADRHPRGSIKAFHFEDHGSCDNVGFRFTLGAYELTEKMDQSALITSFQVYTTTWARLVWEDETTHHRRLEKIWGPKPWRQRPFDNHSRVKIGLSAKIIEGERLIWLRWIGVRVVRDWFEVRTRIAWGLFASQLWNSNHSCCKQGWLTTSRRQEDVSRGQLWLYSKAHSRLFASVRSFSCFYKFNSVAKHKRSILVHSASTFRNEFQVQGRSVGKREFVYTRRVRFANANLRTGQGKYVYRRIRLTPHLWGNRCEARF